MPRCHINDVGKMHALEMEDEVIEAILATNGAGLNIKECSRVLDMGYNDCWAGVYALEQMRKIKVVSGPHGRRLIMPGWKANWVLTRRHEAIFNFLCSKADSNNLVRVSFAKIGEGVRPWVGVGGVSDAIDALDRKGCLEVVERGTHLKANLYKVYPNRDGPECYSWPGTGRRS